MRHSEVVETRPEIPRAKYLFLEVPGWKGHKAGQHMDVRLTAEDGYQAQRSYSIASAPEDGWVALVVERIEDGEVSPYLTDELRVRDRLELRGPMGSWFPWGSEGRRTAVLGGRGIRRRTAHGHEPTPCRCAGDAPTPPPLLLA